MKNNIKVIFLLHIPENGRQYHGDPILPEEEYTQSIEFQFPLGTPIPHIGDRIDFNQYIDNLMEKLVGDWVSVFYDRDFIVDYINFHYDEEGLNHIWISADGLQK